MRGIVLIGMPGCGKSSVGRALARSIDRSFYDSDEEIEREAGMSIAEIFAEKGEAYFRKLERQTIERLIGKESAVISVGGGAPVTCGDLLKRNATVIYLRRDIERIYETLARQEATRPLLRGDGALDRLYAQRRAVYESLCDAVVDNNAGIEDTLARIGEVIP